MSAGTGAVACTVRVHGTVQGVFFRDSCCQRADLLGVAGWVSNEPDGTVAAHFEGPADAVRAMVGWCHEGPPRARVDRVDEQPATVTGVRGFTVR